MRRVYVFPAAQIIGYQLADMLAQIPLRPEAVRRGEPELAAAQPDALGNYSADGLSDGVLAPPVTDLEAVGQRHAVLDQLVIEQRHAGFDRKRHGGAVLHAQEQRQRIDQNVINLNALHRSPGAGAVSPAGSVAPPPRGGVAVAGDGSVPSPLKSRLRCSLNMEKAARPLGKVAI